MLACAAALTLISAGVAVVGSTQPAAATAPAVIHRSSWAYIDSRNPTVSYFNTTDDAPVGALRDADGKSHKYQSFFTFDVSRFLGRQVSQVTLYTRETQAQDCVDRQVELWSTGPVDASTTWENPPTESQKLYTLGYFANSGCPAAYVAWDATAAVQQAVAAGSSVVTLELRVPETAAGDTNLGRRFSNDLAMTVMYNTTPDVPTDLKIDNRACATGQPYTWEGLAGRDNSRLSAQASDPDGGLLGVEFAIWPVDHPDQRTTMGPETGVASGTVAMIRPPAGAVVDGVAYGFAARAVDPDGAYSAWSQSCYFQTDYTPPANPPVVSSTDYPADGNTHGGQGIPGTFTFSANGVPDVVGFVYGWFGATGSASGDDFVPVDHPGGSGTVVLSPPSFTSVLTVASVDAAGNFSNDTNYTFLAVPTPPIIRTVGWPRVGRPFPVTFTPNRLPPGYDSVVSYTYTVNGGPEQTVPAGPDGTASVELTFTDYSTVAVRLTSSNGWVSPTAKQYFYPDASPSVSSDTYAEAGTSGGVGQTGTFTFGSNFAGSTEFYYSFDWGATWQTVPVGPDGTASVTWTPETVGDFGLYVYSQTADGTQSDWYLYEFYVSQ